MQPLHVMVLATILHCALSATFFAPENAADAWGELFLEMQGIEIPQGAQSDWTNVEQEQYEQLAPFRKRIQEIAAMPTCDWELDYSQGFDLELPHLGNIRSAMFLMSFSIQGDLEAGNYDNALSGMETILGISQDVNNQRAVVCSLVSYSMFGPVKEMVSVIDDVHDVSKLEEFKKNLDNLDQFDPFGIRESLSNEQQFFGDWLIDKEVEDLEIGGFIHDEFSSDFDMEFEVARYDEAMERLVEVFQMTDESHAVKAMEVLQEEVSSGEFGELTKVLFISGNNLLKSAFLATKDVKEMQSLVQQRIDMLTAPNAATYFLQAVDTYCAIDEKERVEAIQKGEFEIIAPTLVLLEKAAEMQPAEITLSNDLPTPNWLAPIYAMTIDGLARGTTGDFITALRVAGHLSQQERLASSVAASVIVQSVIDMVPKFSEENTPRVLEAIRRIPSADAFLILATTENEKTRFEEWFRTQEGWDPTPMALLAATLTLAKENKIDSSCEDCWLRLITDLGVHDDDTIVLAAVTQHLSAVLLHAEFENEQLFVQKLRRAKNQLPMLRRKLTTPPARR
ncbi:MAG: hypothetical protein H8E91_05000 [Planctomycetes bacterium]|nr:hypothetical protein [Planctomycetota bacterium]